MTRKCISETLKLLPATDTEGGMLLDQINEKLAELVRAVDGEGKPGEICIKLKFKRNNGAIAIEPDITAKIPRAKPDATLLWATAEGNLVTENPSQRKLPFAEQPGRAATVLADAQPTTTSMQPVELVKPSLAVVDSIPTKRPMAG